jgi:hypothetical protein
MTLLRIIRSRSWKRLSSSAICCGARVSHYRGRAGKTVGRRLRSTVGTVAWRCATGTGLGSTSTAGSACTWIDP